MRRAQSYNVDVNFDRISISIDCFWLSLHHVFIFTYNNKQRYETIDYTRSKERKKGKREKYTRANILHLPENVVFI